ncbi:DUF5803 family protein [Salinirarus marinus]|uniref:DUF5803 family protein n=1 Tax=Salinirarus marinus TaxID=3068310 RepID=UPI003C6BEAE9
MNRRALGVVALAALALTSGCMGLFGSSPISDEKLDAEPPQPYEWTADEDVHITLTEEARFLAVYDLNRSSIELFRRDGLGGRNAIPVSAVRYRYPNETVITGSEFEARGGAVMRSQERVTVELPDDANASGELAFTSESTPKRFSLPTFVKGSYEVVLPPNRRVEAFLFGKVSPPGHEVTRSGGQTHIRWENVTADTVSVRYYLQRDLLIFGAIAAVLLVVGLGGAVYYKRAIEALRERREEMGLDVDTEDDDFGRNPPPGM